MSHVVVTLVLQCFRGESGRKRDVALAIADSCPDHTGERMYKAIDNIAHSADVARSTAEAAISHFVKVGWLIKVRQGGQGPRSTSEYKINPAWMALASEEMASAMQQRRRTNRVPISIAAPAPAIVGVALDVDARSLEAKHPSLGCLADDLSTRVLEPKHPNLEPKHPSYSGTNSERIELNTPLPPCGGESEFEKVVREFPRKDVADLKPSRRAFKALETQWQAAGTSAREQAERMCEAIHRERSGRQWLEQDGKFVPRLSRWLRGWGCGGEALSLAQPAPPAIKTEAQKSAEMLSAMAVASAKAKPPPADIAAKIAALRGKRVGVAV